jgi:hypothetical protein
MLSRRVYCIYLDKNHFPLISREKKGCFYNMGEKRIWLNAKDIRNYTYCRKSFWIWRNKNNLPFTVSAIGKTSGCMSLILLMFSFAVVLLVLFML